MAKINNFLRYILCIALCTYSTFAYSDSEQIRNKLSSIYLAEIGVRELTGHNDGKQVEAYLASCHLKKGQPYCAAFVCWSFKQAGITAITSGYSPNWFPANKLIYKVNKFTKSVPLSGDVGGMYFPAHGRIAHTFFIHSWPAYGCETVITVEANTSRAGAVGSEKSRDGDGVYKKRRLKHQIYTVSRWI